MQVQTRTQFAIVPSFFRTISTRSGRVYWQKHTSKAKGEDDLRIAVPNLFYMVGGNWWVVISLPGMKQVSDRASPVWLHVNYN